MATKKPKISKRSVDVTSEFMLQEIIDYELQRRHQEIVGSGMMSEHDFRAGVDSMTLVQLLEFCHLTVEVSDMEPFEPLGFEEHLVR